MTNRVVDNTMPPSWKSKKFLAGKLSQKKRREMHEWRLANEPGYKELVDGMAVRNALIVKARALGLLDWASDVDHYKGGQPYCKCPGGTVEAHNARHDAVLVQVGEAE